MEFQKYVNSVAQENTYLLTSDTGAQLLIDPGSDYLKYLPDLKQPAAVFLTHAHFDHIMGLSALREKFADLPIWLAEAEKDWLQEPNLNCSTMLPEQVVFTTGASDFYKFDQLLEIADFSLEVRATPGHSIGSVSFIFSNAGMVISGDALFKNSIGRTDLPTGNYNQLIHSIKTELLTLPDDYKVYPGHGEHTTIGEERVSNPFLS